MSSESLPQGRDSCCSENNERFLDFARNDKSCSESQLRSRVSRTPERRKTKNFRIMLVCQIIDAAKDRQVRIDFIFRRDVDETIIFNVEVWPAEIEFFARIDEFPRYSGAQFLPPEI